MFALRHNGLLIPTFRALFVFQKIFRALSSLTRMGASERRPRKAGDSRPVRRKGMKRNTIDIPFKIQRNYTIPILVMDFVAQNKQRERN